MIVHDRGRAVDTPARPERVASRPTWPRPRRHPGVVPGHRPPESHYARLVGQDPRRPADRPPCHVDQPVHALHVQRRPSWPTCACEAALNFRAGGS